MATNKRVLPSRAQLQLWKGKLVGAKKGHDLLKKKLDGLKKSFRDIMHRIINTKKSMGDDMNDALYAMAEAQWGAGDFGRVLLETIKRASTKVSMGQSNVAGVYLPVFHYKHEPVDGGSKQLGILGGGAAIQKCRERFVHLLMLLVELAGLQTSFVTLDEVIKVTSRRVNALENVIIPRIQGFIEYIKRELDEMEREDFFRMKKIQNNKRKQIERERMYKEKMDQERENHDNLVRLDDKDEDIIF